MIGCSLEIFARGGFSVVCGFCPCDFLYFGGTVLSIFLLLFPLLLRDLATKSRYNGAEKAKIRAKELHKELKICHCIMC